MGSDQVNTSDSSLRSSQDLYSRSVPACGIAIRSDFPFFSSHPTVAYLDSAATAQKPTVVLDAMNQFYARYNANVHRGAYPIADEASRMFEDARREVARFIGASSHNQIVFTKNATEALNLAAHGIASTRLSAGDEIVLSTAEHHANLVPWQHYAARFGARLVFLPVTDEGVLDLDAAAQLISSRTKVVAITHCSNVLGVLNPIAQIVALARRVGAVVVVDGAQSVAHGAVNVQELDCDVLAFSGHKLGGPTGIGVLYARTELLDQWPPLLFGGGMVDTVDFTKTTYAPPPHRFEAGTPPIAEAIGLAAALRYLNSIGMKSIAEHGYALRAQAATGLSEIPGVRILGPQRSGNEGGIISFAIEGIHPHDLAWYCGDREVCVRAGSHCAHPLLKSLGLDGTVRASFYLYSTEQEVERLITTVDQAVTSLRR